LIFSYITIILLAMICLLDAHLIITQCSALLYEGGQLTSNEGQLTSNEVRQLLLDWRANRTKICQAFQFNNDDYEILRAWHREFYLKVVKNVPHPDGFGLVKNVPTYWWAVIKIVKIARPLLALIYISNCAVIGATMEVAAVWGLDTPIGPSGFVITSARVISNVMYIVISYILLDITKSC